MTAVGSHQWILTSVQYGGTKDFSADKVLSNSDS